jgi:hypothetical protein
MHVKLSHFPYEFKKGLNPNIPFVLLQNSYILTLGVNPNTSGVFKEKSYGPLGTLENVLTSVSDPNPCGSALKWLPWIQIRIQGAISIRIHMDPDPKHWLKHFLGS